MSSSEIPRTNQLDLDDIVREHTRAHRTDQFNTSIVILMIGFATHLMVISSFFTGLVFIGLAGWGVWIWIQRPDLGEPVSNDEIKALSPFALDAFAKISKQCERQSGRPVLISDLAAHLRAAKRESATATLRHKEEMARKERETQESALYEAQRERDRKRDGD